MSQFIRFIFMYYFLFIITCMIINTNLVSYHKCIFGLIMASFFFISRGTVVLSVHDNKSINVSYFCIHLLVIKLISISMLVSFQVSWWHKCVVGYKTRPDFFSRMNNVVIYDWQNLLLCCWREHENDCFPIYTTWILLMVLMCNEPEEWKFSTRVWKKSELFKMYRAIHMRQNVSVTIKHQVQSVCASFP